MNIIIIILLLILINYVYVSTNGLHQTRDQITKYDILKKLESTTIGKKHSLNTIIIDNTLQSIKYPVIFKPEFCSGGGKFVKKINNVDEANKYIKDVNGSIIAQEFHPGPYEIGLLYRKNLFSKSGTIESIVLKKGSSVYCGNMCKCGCEDLTHKKTIKLEEVIQNIMSVFPNFSYGRFDLRCSDLDKFFNGDNFKIVELNGCMSFDLRLHTNKNILFKYFILSRMVLRNLLYGIINIVKGNGQNIYLYMKSLPNKIAGVTICKDWEVLFADWD